VHSTEISPDCAFTEKRCSCSLSGLHVSQAGFKKHSLVGKTKVLQNRHTAPGQGAMLKCEKFPELAAALQYAFGEGDRIERGGGGLETDPRFQTGTLYRTSDARTTMTDAKLALLSIAPPDFSISLSSCYNYTQNYKAGTRQAKQHHAGTNVNVCISLHAAPRTKCQQGLVINTHWTSAGPCYKYSLDVSQCQQDLVINTHWTSANVNVSRTVL
jgi:hypothetical protein